ncbi:Hypothetical predicted protein [Cloeon dipterum]|uniref:Origin recognition complex subunit 2 n=1 Tax=Cloeon dipterum TaxID=197152 RepID=A0A8S1CDU1_9INSE|nr:Hypothetical predicted protein [Cloeon dipterum]
MTKEGEVKSDDCEDYVKVKVICGEDVEKHLFIKGSKEKVYAGSSTKRRTGFSTASDHFEPLDEFGENKNRAPLTPKALFAEDSLNKSRDKADEVRRGRRKSVAPAGGLQPIPEAKEITLSKKRAASDNGCDTPERKRRRNNSVEEEPPKTPSNRTMRNVDMKTPESAKQTPGSKRRVLDTPRLLRTNVKKCIGEMLCESDSDAISEESESESEEEVFNDVRDSVETPPKKEEAKIKIKKQTKSFSAEDYFDAHVSSKVITSNHSLRKLEKPRLDQDTINDALQKMPKKHEKECKIIFKNLESKFRRWQCLLLEGFSLLLYGLGSKASLLNSFRKLVSSDEDDAIVINGFFPTLTLRDIFSAIIRDTLDYAVVPGDENECCNIILRHFNHSDSHHLYLLINNIDGQALQSSKAQNAIARISMAKKLHLVASIDHINAPLLLDQCLLAKLNLVWQDSTTMLPYYEETAFENSVMVQQSGKMVLSSLHSVFQSLTTNAKKILNILMENQLNAQEANYPGMSFRDLYQEAREQFVVSSNLALRAQLTEFLDHKLVKMKKGFDGSEMLHLPLPPAILKEFKSTHNFDSL